MSQLKFEVKVDGEIITATNDYETMHLAWVKAFTEALEELKISGDKTVGTETVEVHMHDENRKISVTISTDKINPEGE